VLESFGFASFLRQKTGGQAFPQMIFSHWAPLAGNPLEAGSPAYTQVMAVRERKGLKGGLPALGDYYDKL
jgi:elongation factor 2